MKKRRPTLAIAEVIVKENIKLLRIAGYRWRNKMYVSPGV